ncbi:hypothetical protein ACI789_15905 [Geodermatophilus sp. SYSU D00965]
MSLVLLLPVVAAMAALVVPGVLRRTPPSRERAVAAARQHAGLGSAAALVAGAAGALGVGTTRLDDGGPGSLGVTALLVPITFGVLHTVVLGLAELAWPRPEGTVRRARLQRRGLLDAAPRWLVRTTVVAAVAAAATIALGAALAAPDGRSILVEAPPVRSTASPFPGLLYGRPAMLGLLLLAALTAGALWIVATRPAVATEDERVEAALRRASVHRVLRGAAAATLVVTGGLLGAAGSALWSVSTSTGQQVLGAVGVGVGGCGFAALLAGVAVACVRAPGVPAGEPAVQA